MNKHKVVLKTTEKINAKEMPRVLYCKHIQAGVVQYENEMVLIDNPCLKKMMPTMEGVPVYVEHTLETDLEKRVENLEEEADGYVSECFYNEKDGWFWAKFIVVSEKGQEAIRKNYTVSNGYSPTQSGNGGSWHNIEYKREILDGSYTQLALVTNPRYEDACIMTGEEFKRYNQELTNELEELKNSKEESNLIIGGKKVKFFRTKKEEIVNASEILDAEMPLENGKSIKVSEMVNALRENEKINESTEIAVGDRKMTIKELVNEYTEMVKEKEKQNKCDEEKKNADEDADEDADENADADKKKAEEKKNADEEKKKDEEKKNSKHHDELKNSIKNGNDGNDTKSTYETNASKEKRGQERY